MLSKKCLSRYNHSVRSETEAQEMIIQSAFDKTPVIEPGSYIAENAVITGDVEIQAGASIWYNAVLRGDSGKITISERANIQDNVTIHEETYVGHDVTVGHGAILHGCRIEPNCLIGMHSTVMDNAVIGEGSVVAAGCVVTKGQTIPPGSIVMGVPGKIVSESIPGIAEQLEKSALHYITLAKEQLPEMK